LSLGYLLLNRATELRKLRAPDPDPLRTRWFVDSIPMVYVIDAGGVIRAKDVEGKALDDMGDNLVNEAQAMPRKET
jgi:hypothetical protein